MEHAPAPSRRCAAGAALLLLCTATGPLLAAFSAPGAASAAPAGAPEPHDDSAPPSHPSSFVWSNGEVALTLVGETPTFTVASVTNASASVSVSVLGVIEVNPLGNAVAVAPFAPAAVGWRSFSSNVSGGLVVNLSATVPVYRATGPWNSTALPEAQDGQLGAAATAVTFHLGRANTSLSPYAIEFDLGLAGWPWVSAHDRLGLGVAVHSVGAASMRAGSDDLEERANGTGAVVATVRWAPVASVTDPNGTVAVAAVTNSTVVASDDLSGAIHLLFGGVAGGYSSLFYDPTVTMNSAVLAAVPGGEAASSLFDDVSGYVGAGAGAAVAVAVAALAFRRGSAHPRSRLSDETMTGSSPRGGAR